MKETMDFAAELDNLKSGFARKALKKLRSQLEDRIKKAKDIELQMLWKDYNLAAALANVSDGETLKPSKAAKTPKSKGKRVRRSAEDLAEDAKGMLAILRKHKDGITSKDFAAALKAAKIGKVNPQQFKDLTGETIVTDGRGPGTLNKLK
jgi:hypothetical protein